MQPSKAEAGADRVLTPASGAWRFWVVPQWRDWLDAKGYLRPARAYGSPARRAFSASPRRENAWRDDGPQGVRIFDKALSKIRWRDRIAIARLGGPARGSPLLHEFRMLLAARERGIRVPAPLAAGERRRFGFACEGFLVVKNLGGDSLADWAESGPQDRASTARIAEATGVAVAALHRSGISFPSMFGKHVYLGTEDDPAIGFLDLADASLHRRMPSARVRSRDLGALAATLPRRAFSLTIKLRALQAYLAALGEDPARWRTLWKRASCAASRHSRLRRNRIFASPYALPSSCRHHPGEEDEVNKCLDLLRAFGIAAPQTMPLPAEQSLFALSLQLPEDAEPSERPRDPGAEFGELFVRILRAGFMPCGPVVARMQVSPCNRILLTLDALRSLQRPPKLTKRGLRRAAARLIRELRDHPRWSPHADPAAAALSLALPRLL